MNYSSVTFVHISEG